MADHHAEPDPMHHVTPKSMYFVIFAALMVLTATTTGIAYLDLGVFNTPVALVIAFFKATLVILFFMHVKYSTRLTWTVVIGAFLWLAIMFVLMFADYMSRGWVWPDTGPWGIH